MPTSNMGTIRVEPGTRSGVPSTAWALPAKDRRSSTAIIRNRARFIVSLLILKKVHKLLLRDLPSNPRRTVNNSNGPSSRNLACHLLPMINAKQPKEFDPSAARLSHLEDPQLSAPSSQRVWLCREPTIHELK